MNRVAKHLGFLVMALVLGIGLGMAMSGSPSEPAAKATAALSDIDAYECGYSQAAKELARDFSVATPSRCYHLWVAADLAGRGHDWPTDAPKPRELTPEERAGTRETFPMEPIDMRFRFLSHDEFERQRPKEAAAWTDLGMTPCTVDMDADRYSIIATPRYGDARWAEPWYADSLAHEALHCLRGHWHPDWDVIQATEKSDEGLRIGSFLQPVDRDFDRLVSMWAGTDKPIFTIDIKGKSMTLRVAPDLDADAAATRFLEALAARGVDVFHVESEK